MTEAADIAVEGMTDEVDAATVLMMRDAVPEKPEAALLVRQMISFSATYDHIVDRDEWETEHVHTMVEILLSGLPNNRFYTDNVTTFLPIIMNAIHAWRYAEKCPAYRVKVGDGLSELGCAMLYVTGGSTRLRTWGGMWRDQVLELMEDSDKGET
jgi:hypothetical protein